MPLALQKLKLAPAIVSPNGDGRGDEAKVTYVLSAAATVTASVTDSLDQPVATVLQRHPRRQASRSSTWAPDAIPGRLVPADADRGRRGEARADLDALLGRPDARRDDRERAGVLADG